MANLSDLIGGGAQEQQDPMGQSKPQEGDFMEKVQGFQQRLSKMQSKLAQAAEPTVKDVIRNQLAGITGQAKAKEGLIQKQADSAIQGILHPAQPENLAQEGMETLPGEEAGFMDIQPGEKEPDGTKQDPDAAYGKLSPGYRWKDINDKSKGAEPIPGAGKDTKNSGEAAKIAMMEAAQVVMGEIPKDLFNKDGTPNRTLIIQSHFNLPWSDGRDLRTKFEQGIQAITRGETGAAMPDTEVDNTRERFFPTPYDTDEQIHTKWFLYRHFVNNYLKLTTGKGKLDYVQTGKNGEPRFNKALADNVATQYSAYLTKTRKQWTQRFIKANPNATPEQAQEYWNWKVKNDPRISKGFKFNKGE